MNKKLIAPIVTAAAMLATSVGSTFALFSSKASSRIDINAGKLEVKLTKGDAQTYSVEANESGDRIDENGYKYSSEETAVNGVFTNGGTATFTDCNLALDKISPGDRIVFDLNASQGETNIIYKYRVVFEYTSEDETIGRGMEITTNISGDSKLYKNLKRYQSAWAIHDPANPLELDISFDMELPVTCGNEYQEKLGAYSMYIEAVQGNAAVTGEELIEYFPDASYGFANSYQAADGHWIHEISNAEEFRNILDSSAHDGKAGRLDYPGAADKTTEYLLTKNIDFDGSCWNTSALLDDAKANAFIGVLTSKSTEPVILSNIHVNAVTGSGFTGKAVSAFALFDRVYDAKISNLILDDMTIDVATDGKVAALLALGNDGSTYKDYLEIENITVNANCSVSAQASAGGILGTVRSYNDHVTIKNCTNNASVTGSLSTGGTNIGGIISQTSQVGTECTVTFENCVNNGAVSGGLCVGGISGAANPRVNFIGCANNGDLICSDGIRKGQSGNTVYQNVGSMTGSVHYKGNGATREPLYDVTFTNCSNSGKIKISNIELDEKTTDFMAGQIVNYKVGGEFVDSPNVEQFNSLFVEKFNNVKIPMEFNSENKLVITAPQGVTVDKYVLTVWLTKTEVVKETNKTTPGGGMSPGIFATIEIAPEDLNSFDFTKVTQVGFFAPDASYGCPTYVQSNPDVTTKQAAYTYGFIDYSYQGLPELTAGYHSDANGGYIVSDATGQVGNVYYALHIWNKEQYARYTLTAYDVNGTAVANGEINCADEPIHSGILNYGGTVWHE